jgi:hypothetical protein
MKLLSPRIYIVQLILLDLDGQTEILCISLENVRVIANLLLVRVFHPVLSRARAM